MYVFPTEYDKKKISKIKLSFRNESNNRAGLYLYADKIRRPIDPISYVSF